MLEANDGLAAHALDFASAYAVVLVVADTIEVGGDYLKLQTGASRIQNQDIHAVPLCGWTTQEPQSQDKLCLTFTATRSNMIGFHVFASKRGWVLRICQALDGPKPR